MKTESFIDNICRQEWLLKELYDTAAVSVATTAFIVPMSAENLYTLFFSNFLSTAHIHVERF